MNLSLLTKDQFVCFTTREFATEIAASVSAASKQLSRLKSKGIIDKLTKGELNDLPYATNTALFIALLFKKGHLRVKFNH